VDDDDVIRELVYYALKSEGYKVVCFENTKKLLKQILSEKPALILFDLMMPYESGLELLRNLKEVKDTAAIPVILMTALTDESIRVEGLDSGADDYITKPFSVSELLARVRAVLRRTQGDTMLNPESLSLGQLSLNTKKRLVYTDGLEKQGITLTYLEFELLHCLLRHKDVAMSRDQLLDLVWKPDEDGGPADRNVDMQVRALRKKLGFCGDMIKTVRGIGYKISE